MTAENPLICPSCQRPDKVEKVSSIVEETYPITPAENTVPVHWAGKTYYVPARKEAAKVFARPGLFKKPREITIWSKTISPLDWSLVKGPAPRLLPWMARPQPPHSITGTVTGIGGWIAGSMVLVWLGVARRIKILTIVGAIMAQWQTNLLFMVLGLRAWAIRRNHKLAAEYEKKLGKLPQAEAKWNELYFCYRCNGVFTKVSDFVPWYKMQDFLYE